MGLEVGTDIADLNPSWPLGTDPKSQGDDHLRLIKTVMQNDAARLSEPNTWVAEQTFEDTVNGGGFRGSFFAGTAQNSFRAQNDTLPTVAFQNVAATVTIGNIRGDFTNQNVQISAYDAAGENFNQYVFGNASQDLVSNSVLRKSDGDTLYGKVAGNQTWTGVNNYSNDELVAVAFRAQSSNNISQLDFTANNGALYTSLRWQIDGLRVRDINGATSHTFSELNQLPSGTSVVTRATGDARYTQTATLQALVSELETSGVLTPAQAATILAIGA